MLSDFVARSIRRLDPAELVLGLVLPDHLRDRTGRILIRRGRMLTASLLRIIERYTESGVYVGPDWSPPLPGPGRGELGVGSAEWQQARGRQRRPAGVRARLRRQPRHRWRGELCVVLQESSSGSVRRRRLLTTACDLSGGGFAFTCEFFVHAGTTVYIRFEPLPDRPIRKGIVRNCVHTEGRAHRVGVEFVAFDAREVPPPEL